MARMHQASKKWFFFRFKRERKKGSIYPEGYDCIPEERKERIRMRLTGMCNVLKITIHNSKPFKQSRIRKVNRAKTHLRKVMICFLLMMTISVFCLTALKTNQFLSFGATYIDGKWFEKFKETLPEIQDNQRGNSSGNIANFGFFLHGRWMDLLLNRGRTHKVSTEWE